MSNSLSRLIKLELLCKRTNKFEKTHLFASGHLDRSFDIQVFDRPKARHGPAELESGAFRS